MSAVTLPLSMLSISVVVIIISSNIAFIIIIMDDGRGCGSGSGKGTFLYGAASSPYCSKRFAHHIGQNCSFQLLWEARDK